MHTALMLAGTSNRYALYQSIHDPEEFEWDYLAEDAFTGSSWDTWRPHAVVKVDETVNLAKVNTQEVAEGKPVPGIEYIWHSTCAGSVLPKT